MKDRIIISVAIVIGLSMGGGVIWLWRTTQARQNNQMTSSGSTTSSASTISDDTSSGGNSTSLLGVSQTSGSLSIDGGQSSSGTLQSQGLTAQGNETPSQSQTNSAAGGQSTTSAPKGESATLNPAEFGTYEKYKNGQSAMFAEIKLGTGAEASSGKKASLNYKGWLTNGTVFDENLDTTKPFSFTLGAGSVIAGWEQTVAGMKVGGERLLIVPPYAGYKDMGQGPIPGNAVLVFYVKLVAVE